MDINSLYPYLLLIISGIIGGYIAGLIGIGGGTIYIFVIPILLKQFQIPDNEIAQYTIANSMFAIIFASFAANMTLIKEKRFFFFPTIITGIAAIATAHFTLKAVVYQPFFNKTLFNFIIIVLMTFMLVYTLLGAKRKEKYQPNELHRSKYIITGAVGGIIASISGLGGGIVIIPILNSIFKIDVKKASAISSGVITMSAIYISIQNLIQPVSSNPTYSLGYIVFPIALLLSLTVILSSPLGVKKATNLPAHKISYAYATILAIVIFKKISELIF